MHIIVPFRPPLPPPQLVVVIIRCGVGGGGGRRGPKEAIGQNDCVECGTEHGKVIVEGLIRRRGIRKCYRCEENWEGTICSPIEGNLGNICKRHLLEQEIITEINHFTIGLFYWALARYDVTNKYGPRLKGAYINIMSDLYNICKYL